VLQRGRTPLQVVAAAERAATLADQAIQEAIERSPPAPTARLSGGCARCCHKLVGASAAEVLRITDFLRIQLAPAELQAVRKRVVRPDEERRALQQDHWAESRVEEWRGSLGEA
jgi:hypothetical protein